MSLPRGERAQYASPVTSHASCRPGWLVTDRDWPEGAR
jgi:hypothetical protein